MDKSSALDVLQYAASVFGAQPRQNDGREGNQDEEIASHVAQGRDHPEEQPQTGERRITGPSPIFEANKDQIERPEEDAREHAVFCVDESMPEECRGCCYQNNRDQRQGLGNNSGRDQEDGNEARQRDQGLQSGPDLKSLHHVTRALLSDGDQEIG